MPKLTIVIDLPPEYGVAENALLTADAILDGAPARVREAPRVAWWGDALSFAGGTYSDSASGPGLTVDLAGSVEPRGQERRKLPRAANRPTPPPPVPKLRALPDLEEDE